MIRKYRSAMPTICGFGTQKNHIFSSFLTVFLGTVHDLMVPAKPRNTHPRLHLMQKEPTDLLNFPRRWTILGV